MKAYLILDLSITNLDSFMDYAQQIPAHIAKHGGRYLVKGAVPSVIEGDWLPERVVVIEFGSRASAEAFLADPNATALFAIRHGSTNSNLILVDGAE